MVKIQGLLQFPVYHLTCQVVWKHVSLENFIVNFYFINGLSSCYQFHPSVFHGIRDEVYDSFLYFSHFQTRFQNLSEVNPCHGNIFLACFRFLFGSTGLYIVGHFFLLFLRRILLGLTENFHEIRKSNRFLFLSLHIIGKHLIGSIVAGYGSFLPFCIGVVFHFVIPLGMLVSGKHLLNYWANLSWMDGNF